MKQFNHIFFDATISFSFAIHHICIELNERSFHIEKVLDKQLVVSNRVGLNVLQCALTYFHREENTEVYIFTKNLKDYLFIN